MKLNKIYDRIAPIYDLLDYPFEILFYQHMRREFISDLRNQSILEIGVGTGKNIPYYHPSNRVVGIDPSKTMIKEAKTRLRKLQANIHLEDVGLEEFYSDTRFDVIIASFVLYLQEDINDLVNKITSLLLPQGKLIILEYLRPRKYLNSILAIGLSKITKPLYGLDFNSIQTMEILQKYFFVEQYCEYVPDWLYASKLRLKQE